MRVMSASGEVSDPGGRLLQPEAGRVRPKIFLRRSTSRELSEFPDITDDLVTKYTHWEVLRTLFFQSVCNLARFVGLVRTA